MYKEGDAVKLLQGVSPGTRAFWVGSGRDEIPENSVGAVVAVYNVESLATAYEVEFVAADGETLGIVTLHDSDIAPP
ncbi:DUF4926 domain-containing protein [Nocardia sp. X0981]